MSARHWSGIGLLYKEGVDPRGAGPEIQYAIRVAESIYNRYGHQLMVTSLREGQHMQGSLHPVGMAADLRTRELPAKLRPAIAVEIAAMLGADYDVLLESHHIHIEYDPKGSPGTVRPPVVLEPGVPMPQPPYIELPPSEEEAAARKRAATLLLVGLGGLVLLMAIRK